MRKFSGAVIVFAVALTAGAMSAGSTYAAALATADGDKDPLRLEVTELKRVSGDMVNLKFTITNTGTDEVVISAHYIAEASLGNKDQGTPGAITLMDPVNKKKYLVVRDKNTGECVCSKNFGNMKAGAKVNLWAKFPAPPADVKKIGIIVPNFAPMDDVPLGQ
jgi:hypothetical protein